MKKLFSILAILLVFSTISQAQTQNGFTKVPAGGKYKLIYGSDRVTFVDTTKNPGLKNYTFKKAQLYATSDKYVGGTVTVYFWPSNKVVFKAKATTFRVVGIVSTDSLKVKSITETL